MNDRKEKVTIIRDKLFAQRLETACEGSPNCPTEVYRGKQKWIYDSLEKEFDIKVSPEAVRKWFSGESRPRPQIMSKLARLLEVDEGWLSLGIRPELPPLEQKRRNAMADGAVNLVAGMVQLAGGSIAFPVDQSAHITTILKGKSFSIDAVLPLDLGQDLFRITVSDNLDNKHVIAVIELGNFQYLLLDISPSIIRNAAELRGDYWELTIEKRGSNWRAGAYELRQLSKIADLV